MTTFTTTGCQNENVETALNLLKEIGVDVKKVSCTGYSDVNGISVYFSHETLQDTKRIRVSDHSLKNHSKMEDNICFSFDSVSFRGNLISKLEINKEKVQNSFSFLK